MRRHLSVFLSLATLLVIVSGSVVTTEHRALGLPLTLHPLLGTGLGVLTFLLGIWCFLDTNPVLRSLGVLIALTTGVEAAPGMPLVHAFFAPVLFAALAVVATFRPLKPLPSGALASFRLSVLASPALILLQIGLGVLHRHERIGVMWHMGGAMLVAGFIVVLCALLLQSPSDSPVLRSSVVSLLAAVITQVILGVVVYVMRMLDAEIALPLIVAAGLHVATGAVTFAAAAILAVRFQRGLA